MKKYTPAPRGFTLIELLVVIAIIGILASIVMASVALARTNALDVRKEADLASVRTAMQAYNVDKGHMPDNFDCSGATCVVSPARTTLAIQDMGGASTESGRAYTASMQELVSLRYLSDIPRSPSGAGYAYYNYGPGTSVGAIIGTTLDGGEPTLTGKTGTCRPFADSTNLTFLDTIKSNLVHPGTMVAAVELALGGQGGNGVIGGGGPSGIGTCIYEVDGVSQEVPCPSGTTNICSAVLSKDFCFCNPY